jgi:hypothetical protein
LKKKGTCDRAAELREAFNDKYSAILEAKDQWWKHKSAVDHDRKLQLEYGKYAEEYREYVSRDPKDKRNRRRISTPL